MIEPTRHHEGAYTTESKRFAPVLDFYDTHVRQPGERHSPFLLRELYGEHAPLPEPPAKLAVSDRSAAIIDAISRGITTDDIREELGLYGQGSRRLKLINRRTAARYVQEALEVYTEHLAPIKRPRAAAVRTAIEAGHIKVSERPANISLLGQLPLQRLTILHLTEYGKSEAEIAELMGRRPGTIADYSWRALTALGVSTMAEATRQLREAGIFKINYAPRIPRSIMQEAGLILAPLPDTQTVA